ncbi:isochorismatase family protein [Streptomyces sp. PTD5-9]|uniref:isochorismatase family protein n=1 Tax=Streptomyces sp. PTD5-9 TaxID=3120150 RepID=UPI00300A4AA9
MSEHSKFLEPITRENVAVVLVDHQVGLLSGVRDISLGELKHNVAALARAATVLRIPLVVTTTAADSMWGPTAAELVQALPAGQRIIDRSTVNAWHDDRVRAAIEATGRQKLIFAGVSLEVCAALPAISATAVGHDAYVAVDASGTFSPAKREAGLLRMQQAGVIVSDYATLMVEALADNAAPESGALYAALDMPFAVLVGQISAAHHA